EPAADSDAMTRKVVNDAAAYIRGLAELRGRNADWAEKAVREAVSLSASEAKEQNVIDFIAADTRALLNAIDGFEVDVRGRSVTLATADMQVEVIDPDWRTELLGVITNPNIIYLLMLLGFYGLIFELANPGNIFPGVVGAICLLLALYAVQVLPVNYAGVALIVLGVAFMVGELFMPSFGALGIGGLIAFVIGSIIMFDPASTGYQVSLWLIGASAALTALFIMAAIGLMLKSHRRAVTTGSEEMLTARGRVLEDFSGGDVYTGRVFIHGETWQAHSQHKLTTGQGVRVISRDGLKLEVEAVAEDQPALET
ncbi:MAG: nodulation protein NfeD, partial [Gammaproteobacteria bacterium]